MYSEVHATIGWLIAQPVEADRRFRASVTIAGLAPDLDAATYLLGSHWFTRYHHVWTHNVFFGLLVSGIAAWVCQGRRRLTFLFTQLAFWAHYLGDYFFSRMPIAAFWPLSEAKFGYIGALALWHPFNHLLVWVSLVALAWVALRLKRTPLEILSPALDARFVNFFFRRRDTPCAECGRLGNETCAECGRPVCGRHGSMAKGFRVACGSCRTDRRAKAEFPARKSDPIGQNPGFMKRPLPLSLCLASLLICVSTTRAADTPPPNIIFMMADDMGMGDTSAYQDFTGNADDVQLRTPNMERLARMGMRFTDAHTSSSRCTPTRYGLMTGRYPWRSRMKWWVLFGSQGDPMIEADRPTVASMLRDSGYRTAMFGKWHVGLRYRSPDGSPAAGWEDADLTQPLHTTPLDHGFDVARFTSRSHGTSGPDAAARPKKGKKSQGKANGPKQNVGPGHIHGRNAVGATKNGKQLVAKGPNAYVLTKLGGRHSDNAIRFMGDHVADNSTSGRPFFVYYPANSNHSPYTPDDEIGGKPVKGAARTIAGKPMDARHDYIYENDVALGRMLEWLETANDPRRPGHKLIENTVVVFTSDNGAEKNSDIASGPFRSHKGSCYEGGHRVPFIVSWPAGGVGDGNERTPGRSNASPIGLQDMYATFAEIVGRDLPDLRAGRKGAEDSFSVLSAFRGKRIEKRPPLFFNDHKERKDDPAASAMRLDSPTVDGRVFEGQWKIFYDASLLREGKTRPYELFNLAADQREKDNLLERPEFKPLVDFLNRQALLHRNSGGHRMVAFAGTKSRTYDWREGGNLHDVAKQQTEETEIRMRGTLDGEKVKLTLNALGAKGASKPATISPNPRGLGISGGKFEQVDEGEAFVIRFDKDVIVDHVAIVAGNGVCGGFYRVGDKAPLAIYCVDADNDAKTQEGVISDIGLLKAGEALRLESSPHLGVEAPGRWRLGAISFRLTQ